MNFNKHYELTNRHAFLSPSKYYWSNWDEEKLDVSYNNFLATERGTRLHALAAECISLGIKLKDNKTTMGMYVNDAIGYRMTPEQPLYYSDNCFGHADTISFRRNKLRIHDLKTGEVTPGSMRQLEIYAALFCLEYDVNPFKIEIELRIYQFDQAIIHNPDPQTILDIMNKIKVFDERLNQINIGE